MAKQARRFFTHVFVVLLITLSIALTVDSESKQGKKNGKQDKTKQKKKDIRDYNDADMERLFMEWEEAEEEHDPDDRLEHERPPPAVDLSQIDPNNPESALKLTKKGKTLMMFVSVSGNPTTEETETISSRWESMLFNANYQLQRYPVSSDRVIFLLKDGSLAWEIKDFLIQQERCQSVSIEGQEYSGKGSGKKVDGRGRPFGVHDEDAAKAKKQETPKNNKPKKDKATSENAEEKTSKKSTKDKSKEDSKKDKTKTVKPTKHEPKQFKSSKPDKHKTEL